MSEDAADHVSLDISNYSMQPGRDVSRLVEIMAALRAPETGCPWDIEQTFRSIVPYTVEEVYEVVDAIERDDMENLREELGDLLLQVVYHAQMAAERGAFDFADVVEAVTLKMVRRHPHVFGPEEPRTAGMAKGTWERIKTAEKAERAKRRAAMGLGKRDEMRGLLDDVPITMPPLKEALKLQQKLSTVGFDWSDPQAVLPKIREELDEYEAEMKSGNTDTQEGELGDLLFVVTNLARLQGIDPDAALRRTNSKVRQRFAHMEVALTEAGENAVDVSLERLENLWQAAKKSP